jgi:membrane protein
MLWKATREAFVPATRAPARAEHRSLRIGSPCSPLHQESLCRGETTLPRSTRPLATHEARTSTRVRRQSHTSPQAEAPVASSYLRAARGAWPLTKCAVSYWMSDQAATIGAALAFYCAFSLAPLLVIVVTVVGWIVGAETATAQLGSQLTSLFGASTAKTLAAAMEGAQSGDGVAASVISIVSLVIGATTVFAALEAALEQIWGARALVPKGVHGWLRARLLSFGLILAVGFLLLVSLTLSTALSGLRDSIASRFTGFVVLAAVLDFTISIGLITGLIALIYRYLPARRLAWRPVLWGALVTALLFHFGRWAISFYLGRSTQPSAFGAAASFVALLLWLYYSAQIFLLGAEFTACLGGERDATPTQLERSPAKPRKQPRRRQIQ